MEFKVKRDFIPIFLVNAVFVLILACSVLAFLHWTGWLIIVSVVDLLTIFLYNFNVVCARCYIEDGKLIFRTGICQYKIPLDKIAKVTRAINWHVSLSLSCDRVRILVVGETGKQCVYYVSVMDNKGLVNAIKPAAKEEVKVEEPKVEEVKAEEPKVEVSEEAAPAAKKAPAKKPAAKKSTAKKTTAKKSTAKKPATKKAE